MYCIKESILCRNRVRGVSSTAAFWCPGLGSRRGASSPAFKAQDVGVLGRARCPYSGMTRGPPGVLRATTRLPKPPPPRQQDNALPPSSGRSINCGHFAAPDDGHADDEPRPPSTSIFLSTPLLPAASALLPLQDDDSVSGGPAAFARPTPASLWSQLSTPHRPVPSPSLRTVPTLPIPPAATPQRMDGPSPSRCLVLLFVSLYILPRSFSHPSLVAH